MVVILLIAVLAFLYFRGASLQAANQQAVQQTQPNTAASGTPGAQQGVVNGDTYNQVLADINEALKLINKVADTQVQKN